MSVSARLHFFGAAGCVTGSCMMLETDAASVLIDCGMFQGSKTLKALNYEPFPFAPSKIAAVLLTHAHIDHSGLIPKLTRAGFKGPIYATAGTADLCEAMLPDAGAIQEMEVENLNRRNQRMGQPEVSAIYTQDDARRSLQLFKPVPFNAWQNVAPGLRARWWNAGHILGSASIEVEIGQGSDVERLLFSGDIGPGGSAFIADPEGPSGVDHVVMESTYGHADRPPLDAAVRQQALAAEIAAAHAAGGPLLIPAFAVERSQELLVDLIDIMETDRAPPGQIFLDSPLAIKVTKAFLEHGADGAGVNKFESLRESGRLHFTESADESRALERVHGWHVIISASGMCDAGRVRHHLKRLLWRPQATVMLVGYQATGTLGRLLRDGQRNVRIQGEPIRVEARIRALDVYSGHADAKGLLAWAKARQPIAGSVFLTHGEPESRDGIDGRLVAAGFDTARVVKPKIDEAYVVRASAPAEAVTKDAGRIDPSAPGRLDWHNTRVQFLEDLEKKLRVAGGDAERERILRALHGELQKTG